MFDVVMRLASLVLLLMMAIPKDTPIPDLRGKLVYGGEDSLYTRALDENSSATRLGVQGNRPRWSPDGTKIVFDYSPDDVQNDIYVINADGTGLVQLTNNPGNDGSGMWSPNGAKIAFQSSRDGNYEIYIIDANGSNPIRLTNNSSHDESPSWSPDGSKIAFVSNRDGAPNLYVMNSDGSDQQRLISYSSSDGYPEWTPNTHIAFIRDRGAYDYEYYSVMPDGSDVTQITTDLVEFGDFRWLPDGNALYQNNFDLMYLNVSTGVSTRISGWKYYEMRGNYDVWIESMS